MTNSYSFKFLTPALKEFDEAIKYYNDIDPELKDDFIDEVELCVKDILAYPEAWVPFYKDVRRHLLRRFPYKVIYVITSDMILGVSIEHNASEPLTWTERIDFSL